MRRLVLLCCLTLLAWPAHAQPASEATVAVTGDVLTPLTLRPSDLASMPRAKVTINEDGHDVVYEGVAVSEVLKRAGLQLGRDSTVSSYVVAKAKDGYQVVYALAEFDPAFTSSDMIIADTVDGKPLFDYQGPLRIVAPHDKRGARSLRMLTSIQVVRVPR
jgi:DMSO/TMAO reductase YedYZ molybdopterin-dependent catalytic subunit